MRWTYLLPRLFVVVAIAAYVLYGLDPSLRWGVKQSLQSATGRPAEVGRVVTTLWPPSVELRDVRVAEAGRLDRSAIAVDRLSVTLAADAVRQRRLVADELVAEGVRWDLAGDFDALPKPEADEPAGEESAWVLALRERAQSALADLASDFETRAREQLDPDRLETVRMGRKKQTEYEAVADRLEATVRTLRDRALNLEAEGQLIKAAPEAYLNPAEIERLVAEVASLAEQGRSLRLQLASLRQRVPVDVAELRQAKDRDLAQARATLTSWRAEPGRLAEAMLGETAGRAVDSVLTWAPRLARFRQSGDWDRVADDRCRGRTIDFLGREPLPWLAAREVHVHGEATAAGEVWPFELELRNLIAASRTLREPVAFRWANGGTTAVTAVGTLALLPREANSETAYGLTAHYHIEQSEPVAIRGAGEVGTQLQAAGPVVDGEVTLMGDEVRGHFRMSLADVRAEVTSDRASLAPVLATLAIDRPQLTAAVGFAFDPQTRERTITVDSDDFRAIAADLAGRRSELMQAGLAAAKLETARLADEHIAEFRGRLDDELAALNIESGEVMETIALARQFLQRPSAGVIRQVAASQFDLPPVASELLDSPLLETAMQPNQSLQERTAAVVAEVPALLQEDTELGRRLDAKLNEEFGDELADVLGEEHAEVRGTLRSMTTARDQLLRDALLPTTTAATSAAADRTPALFEALLPAAQSIRTAGLPTDEGTAAEAISPAAATSSLPATSPNETRAMPPEALLMRGLGGILQSRGAVRTNDAQPPRSAEQRPQRFPWQR